MALSHLLLKRLKYIKSLTLLPLSQIPNTLYFSSLPNAPNPNTQSPQPPKPTSLSARMSFIFEQIDEIDKQREEKDQTLQRIRAWRDTKKQNQNNHHNKNDIIAQNHNELDDLQSELVKSEAFLEVSNVKKEVELVHPWAEWIELMERLVHHNYFDHKRRDEDGMMEKLGIDLCEGDKGEDVDKGLDFMRDFKTVQAAVINFGRDRFDILRSLSRQDLQMLVGYGCPSEDKRVVFSSKLLRKHVHLDEGDVCSSCSLRNSCEKAYLLTNKEDEPRTIDVMRVLLTYGFGQIDGSLTNKPLLKMKSVKTIVRKLLHEVVKLSAVPIDPNLAPPVYKRPPPKVKIPPPPPRKRVGRNDIEMKKGDWLCPKCDFMNFAKNTVCMQCDAKRPKRQLLPGEWECPECNFLNYRRNTACFHCEHNRPPESYDTETQHPDKQRGGSRIGVNKIPNKADVSNAWNFDFDDNESDGADVAAFEYADSRKLDEDFPVNKPNNRGHEDGPIRPGVGFNDFDEDEDDDDIESYELVTQNDPKPSRIDFSELEGDDDSGSEDIQTPDRKWGPRGKTSSFPTRDKKRVHRKASNSEDDVDFDTDDDLPSHPKWKSSHVASPKRENRDRRAMRFVSDDDIDIDSDDEKLGSNKKGNKWGSSNGVERKRGGKTGFKGGDFSETDSDDDVSNYGDTYRNKPSRGRGGSMNSGFSRNSGGSFDERRGGSFDKRGGGSFDKRGGGSFDRRGGGSFDRRVGGSFDRRGGGSFDKRGGSFDKRGGGSFDKRGGGSFDKRGGGSFDKRGGGSFDKRRGGSFDKRGGKSRSFDNQSDSYMDDEKRRPRSNVR